MSRSGNKEQFGVRLAVLALTSAVLLELVGLASGIKWL